MWLIGLPFFGEISNLWLDSDCTHHGGMNTAFIAVISSLIKRTAVGRTLVQAV
jgi:hypothetical protein